MTEVTESNEIAGVFIVQPSQFGDERGLFVENYRRSWIPDSREMIQGNRSEKQASAVVGMHYHLHQADYWTLGSGHIRVVLHDLREGSPTDKQTLVVDISDGDYRGIYVPPGVAHGFATVADSVLNYLVDGYYNPADELGLAWDDPALSGLFGLEDPIVSERDRTNPRRDEIPEGRRPYWGLRSAP